MKITTKYLTVLSVSSLLSFGSGVFIGTLEYWTPHHWQEVSRTFNPPAGNFECTGSCGDELYWGQTVVRYHCSIHGEDKITYLLGKVL